MSNIVSGRSGGAIITKKENVAAFVHDVAELECAIFTLDKSIEECEERIKEIVSEAERSVESAKHQVDFYKRLLEEYKEKHALESIKCKNNFLKYMIKGLLITFAFLAVTVFFSFVLMGIEKDLSFPSIAEVIADRWPLLIIFLVLGLIITLIVASKKRTEDDYNLECTLSWVEDRERT